MIEFIDGSWALSLSQQVPRTFGGYGLGMARSRYIPSDLEDEIIVRALRDSFVWAPCEVRLGGICDPSTPRHMHHRRMFSRGGTHTRANLLYVCEPCHRAIHSKAFRRLAVKAELLLVRNPRTIWKRKAFEELVDSDRTEIAKH